MRIINDDDKPINKVDIYLTIGESEEFLGRLESYSEIEWEDNDAGNIFGEEDGFDVVPSYLEFYIYTDKNFNSFSEGTKKLILEDK